MAALADRVGMRDAVSSTSHQSRGTLWPARVLELIAARGGRRCMQLCAVVPCAVDAVGCTGRQTPLPSDQLLPDDYAQALRDFTSSVLFQDERSALVALMRNNLETQTQLQLPKAW
jgi:hypothetical protein